MVRRHAFSVLLGLSALAAVTAGLTSCTPEPAAPPSGSTQPSSAAASPEPTASTDGIVVVPAGCVELVPAEQLAALDHLELNDPAMQTAGLPSGLKNPSLAELAESKRVLGCVWENPESRATNLHTTVARITGGDGAAAVKALTDDQVQCYPSQDGTRCEYSLMTDGIDSGETHFFRDDIWIATSWSNVAPPGYTAAIVGVLWP